MHNVSGTANTSHYCNLDSRTTLVVSVRPYSRTESLVSFIILIGPVLIAPFMLSPSRVAFYRPPSQFSVPRTAEGLRARVSSYAPGLVFGTEGFVARKKKTK